MKTEPWSKAVSLPYLRCLWVFLSLLLLPSLFFNLGIPDIYLPLCSTLIALPACIAPLDALGIKPVKLNDLPAVIAGYLAIIVLSALILPLWEKLLHFLAIDYAKQQVLFELLPRCGRLQLIQLFVAVCLITPVVEEIVFRRIIFGEISRFNPAAAFVFTALLFSAVHFFILGIPGLFVMGIFFQLICLYRQNLTLSIIMHALVNSIAFGAALLKG